MTKATTTSMPNRIRRLARKKWLNRNGHHSVGFVHVSGNAAKIYDASEPNEMSFPYVDVAIGDCSRHVTLSFSATSRADISNSRRKFQILLDELEVARAYFEAAVEHHGDLATFAKSIGGRST